MNNIDVKEISPIIYAGFLSQTRHSAFHRKEWLDAIVSTYNLKIRLLGYYRQGELLAVTPLLGRRLGPLNLWGAPLRKCMMPPATIFCSPPSAAQDVLAPFARWLKSQRIKYVQATLPATLDASVGCPNNVELLDNLELDLAQPLEQVWSKIKESQRKCIRRAIRAGVRVHWCTSTDFLPAQQQLTATTYASQGMHPNVPDGLYRTLLANREATGARVLYATYENRVISSLWTFMDADKSYAWDAASLEIGRKLYAYHLLVWCFVRWTYAKGLRTFDFIGSSGGGRGGKRPGISQFKRSMGACPVQYQIAYWYSPTMRLAFFSYRWLSRLRLGLRGRKGHASG